MDEERPRRGAEGTLRSGDILAERYEIVSLLGRGSFSAVYKAIDKRLHKVVAAKVTASPRTDPLASARFLRELRYTREIEVPGVVRYYDGLLHEGELVFVLEYVEGTHLDEWERHQPQAEKLRAYVAIARALAGLHARGLVHRDIKPTNIIVNAAGQPMIADLGLAVNPHELDRLTSTSTHIVGTLLWIAPEQLEGRGAVTPAADVYSLGLMLYQALAGGSSEMAGARLSTLLRARFDLPDPGRMAAFSKVAGAAVGKLVTAMLQPDPSRRPSADEVAVRLDQALARMDRQGAGLSALEEKSETDSKGERVDAGSRSREEFSPSWFLRMGSPVALIVVLLVAFRYANVSNATAPASAFSFWTVLIVLGAVGVRFVVLHRWRVAEPGPAPATVARIEALEAHLASRDQLTQSMALALDDLGNLQEYIRRSVVLALKELPPAQPTSEIAKALETIQELVKSERAPRKGESRWDRWKKPVAFAGAIVVLTSGILGQAIKVGLWRTNHVPEIKSLGPSSLRAAHGAGLDVEAEATDPDGDPLTYHFAATAGAIEEVGNRVHWVPPVAGEPRMFALSVSVSDGSLVARMQRTIAVNALPVVKLTAPSAVSGSAVVPLRVDATDEDGDPLTFLWLASTGNLRQQTNAIVFWEAPHDAGVADLVCQIGDGSETVTVHSSVTVQPASVAEKTRTAGR